MNKEKPTPAAGTQAESPDERIIRLFRALSPEDKRRFLRAFGTVPERRSSPASDHRSRETKAL